MDPAETLPEEDLTEDALLGGRVRLFQPRKGYRVAIDPVLLAAAVPARPGERILDVGIGTGAVSLCLNARIRGLGLTGIDKNDLFVSLSVRNGAENGADLQVFAGDIFDSGPVRDLGRFDHVVTNPPFWEDGRAQASPHATRADAHQMTGGRLGDWFAFCVRHLDARGVLSAILPAARLAEALAALDAQGLSTAIVPLWPKAGAPARRIILQACRTPASGQPAGMTLLPGLVLHAATGGYSAAANEILRNAAPLAVFSGKS